MERGKREKGNYKFEILTFIPRSINSYFYQNLKATHSDNCQLFI